jgi:hypothetical protein
MSGRRSGSGCAPAEAPTEDARIKLKRLYPLIDV